MLMQLRLKLLVVVGQQHSATIAVAVYQPPVTAAWLRLLPLRLWWISLLCPSNRGKARTSQLTNRRPTTLYIPDLYPLVLRTITLTRFQQWLSLQLLGIAFAYQATFCKTPNLGLSHHPWYSTNLTLVPDPLCRVSCFERTLHVKLKMGAATLAQQQWQFRKRGPRPTTIHTIRSGWLLLCGQCAYTTILYPTVWICWIRDRHIWVPANKCQAQQVEAV